MRKAVLVHMICQGYSTELESRTSSSSSSLITNHKQNLALSPVQECHCQTETKGSASIDVSCVLGEGHSLPQRERLSCRGIQGRTRSSLLFNICTLTGLQELLDKIRNVRTEPKPEGYFCAFATRIHCFLKAVQ